MTQPSEATRANLAALPQLDALLRHPLLAEARDHQGHARVTAAARSIIERARAAVLDGAAAPSEVELAQQTRDELDIDQRALVTHVINATGVILHTNLGRAPLSTAARDAVIEAAGYATIEYELTTGKRGSRTAHLGQLAAQVAGTPAATAVNNGAAALVLAIAALSSGKETIVSRGELIEIGGSYRLPDIMQVAGSQLVEVGTTNRTHASDYREAINDATGMLLKIHRSNFQILGFTADVPIDALADIGESHGIPVVHDVGSGLIDSPHDGPLATEPTVKQSVAAGASLVIFSGDKLLGGPQAGIIAGDAELVRKCTHHPLARALRVDKLQRAALESTLLSHLSSDLPVDLPAIAMIYTDEASLRQRAESMASKVPAGDVVRTTSIIGGGASPGTTLPSWGIALPTPNPDALAAELRTTSPPIVGRTEDGQVTLDLRTVPPTQDEELVASLRHVMSP